MSSIRAPDRNRAAFSGAKADVRSPGIEANGFSLNSDSIDLPEGDYAWPNAPGAELVSSHCSSCHSTENDTLSACLPAEKWREIVMKMRDVYRAPIQDDAVPLIVDYLATRPGSSFATETTTDHSPWIVWKRNADKSGPVHDHESCWQNVVRQHPSERPMSGPFNNANRPLAF